MGHKGGVGTASRALDGFGTVGVLLLTIMAFWMPDLALLAGAVALATGLWLKFALVTRASLKLGEDGRESWRVSANYNADRRSGSRYDASTDVFEALLGSRLLHVDPGECTGSDPQQACSFKTASGEVPVESAKLAPDKQTLAWSTSNETLAESVPGVLSQTVALGDEEWRLRLRFDEKGGFRPALAFERTAFVLSKGTLALKGPGLDTAKLSLLLADPNFAYEAGVSTLRVRILDSATVLLDRDFTALGGPVKVGIDSKSGGRQPGLQHERHVLRALRGQVRARHPVATLTPSSRRRPRGATARSPSACGRSRRAPRPRPRPRRRGSRRSGTSS